MRCPVAGLTPPLEDEETRANSAAASGFSASSVCRYGPTTSRDEQRASEKVFIDTVTIEGKTSRVFTVSCGVYLSHCIEARLVPNGSVIFVFGCTEDGRRMPLTALRSPGAYSLFISMRCKQMGRQHSCELCRETRSPASSISAIPSRLRGRGCAPFAVLL